ncbi:MAG: DUF4350 domain-containing protein [Longimicrobiales bacterium]|nr:DUF4350 domain-containing protein [Longimicrobiales bacterium]
MSDLNRHRTYLLWGGVVLAVSLLLVVLLVPGGASVVLDQRRSVERTSPDGIAGWGRSLEELGVATGMRFTDLASDPPGGGGLVLMEPIVELSAREANRVLEWVRRGGVLVYSPGFGEARADSLFLELLIHPQDPYELTTYRDSLVAHRWTDSPRGWVSTRTFRVAVDPKRPGSWEPLSEGDLEGSSLGWLALGDGGVLVIADGRELSNRFLAESEIALTATRAVVDLLASDTLVFSEYHQGMGGSRGLVRESLALAGELAPGRIFLHLVATGALLLLLVNGRFGRPLPSPPAPRRSTVEHVNAVAHIYRAGRSDHTVAHHLVRGAARRAGLDAGGESDEELLERWSRRSDLAEPLRRAREALTADPPDLTALEVALDEMVARHHRLRTPRSPLHI